MHKNDIAKANSIANTEKALSLRELLKDGKYIIPIYQRNFAWEKAEISQLIRDINEFFSDNNSEKSYYIGSLVCFKRDNGDFELVDGQQRHTTISLINAVLKSMPNNKDSVPSTNIKFDSRKNAQRFIEEIHNNLEVALESTNNLAVDNFKKAIAVIREEFHEMDFNVEAFAYKFYNRVKFFRVEVPQDTDLNHYFEIMNNRGEQLEKHEIVKALLMGKIKNDDDDLRKKDQEKLAVIWDACSDMSSYVWFNFDTKIRGILFDETGELKFNTFSEIPILGTTEDGKEEILSSIIDNYQDFKDLPEKESDLKDKYKSVIDFPNFLLQVLSVTKETVNLEGKIEISLDDKKLLQEFKRKIAPREFTLNLLRCRIAFDKYIIKQDLSDGDENKRNWGIRTLNYTNEDYSIRKTFKENVDDVKSFDDEELVKLQTMLYYSNPANTNNRWLQDILGYIMQDTKLEPASYTKCILNIAKNRFDKYNLSYPNISIFSLYFIDFLLWKLYKNDSPSEELKSLKAKILPELFSSFKFKQLNSKEHLLPQSKVGGKDNDEGVHTLGNLCLISSSQNSSANDKHPQYKKNAFKSDNSSLKRLIMFASFNGEKWGKDEIENHKNDIMRLLNESNMHFSPSSVQPTDLQ